MPKTKKMSEKRGARFSVSFTYDADVKLNKLAISCGMSKSELIDYITTNAINSPEYVLRLQNYFNKEEKYRVYLVTEQGKIRYE